MVAVQTKEDGSPRSLLARILDPNGVYLEPTSGYEPFNASPEQAENTSAPEAVAVEVGKAEKADTTQDEKEDQIGDTDEEKREVLGGQDLIDVGLEKVMLGGVLSWKEGQGGKFGTGSSGLKNTTEREKPKKNV